MTELAVGHKIILGYGSNVVVEESDFTIPNKGVTAIIGPNGSGKSTLLHSLAGIIEPLSGSLEVFGASPKNAWKHVAYVMQSPAFPEGTPITVREIVSMGRYPALGWFRRMSKADKDQIMWAMERVDIVPLASRHLDELSGGQRQRVFVAQGIAQPHEALMMDEPLTGLDLGSAKTIDNIIHSEHDNGHAVILTTHDLNEAAVADHVILMNGKVVAAGTPKEVLTRQNLESAYGFSALHETSMPFFDTHNH